MALSNSLVLSKSTPLHLSSGFCAKSVDQSLCPTTLSLNPRRVRNSSVSRSSFVVQAKYSDSDGGNPTAFVGGFILGGLVVGTIGCVFAPQISYALARAERIQKKDLMRKLPKFIYDEEKMIEKQRKKLQEKIDELNLAIDGIADKMREENGLDKKTVSRDKKAVNSKGAEADVAL